MSNTMAYDKVSLPSFSHCTTITEEYMSIISKKQSCFAKNKFFPEEKENKNEEGEIRLRSSRDEHST